MHTRLNIFPEMILIICARYKSLPAIRTMSLEEIEFFYEGLRGQLEKDTKVGK